MSAPLTITIPLAVDLSAARAEIERLRREVTALRATIAGAPGQIEPPGCPIPGACACPGVDAGSFQARNAEWMQMVFADDPSSTDERQDRAAEEFFELMQATGMTPWRLMQLIVYVYGRTAGDPQQELGGTMTTLAGFATYAGLDMAAAAEAELARCQTPEMVAKIRGKRATRHGRGALPGIAPDLITTTAS